MVVLFLTYMLTSLMKVLECPQLSGLPLDRLEIHLIPSSLLHFKEVSHQYPSHLQTELEAHS